MIFFLDVLCYLLRLYVVILFNLKSIQHYVLIVRLRGLRYRGWPVVQLEALSSVFFLLCALSSHGISLYLCSSAFFFSPRTKYHAHGLYSFFTINMCNRNRFSFYYHFLAHPLNLKFCDFNKLMKTQYSRNVPSLISKLICEVI